MTARRKPGESTLSWNPARDEGLRGEKLGGKTVETITTHDARGPARTVHYTDGTTESVSIFDLVGAVIRKRRT